MKRESRPNEQTGESEPMWDMNARIDGSGELSATTDESTLDTLRAEYEQKLADAEGRVLRATAELENFRRRARRDADEQLKYAYAPLMSDLIEVLDNLSRATAAASADSVASNEGIVHGVKMVQNQLETVLDKYGGRRIKATPDTPFDPHLHSALNMQSSETVPAQHVIQETRSGFQLHDRVVRPAQVIVSTGPAKP